VAKLEGKSLLGRPRRKWDDNIKMDVEKIGCALHLCASIRFA
jgi:hypothetical protein